MPTCRQADISFYRLIKKGIYDDYKPFFYFFITNKFARMVVPQQLNRLNRIHVQTLNSVSVAVH